MEIKRLNVRRKLFFNFRKIKDKFYNLFKKNNNNSSNYYTSIIKYEYKNQKT